MTTALFGNERVEVTASAASSETYTITGHATSSSAEGTVWVNLSDDVTHGDNEPEDDSELGTSVEMSTTVNVLEGDEVIVTVYGGVISSMVVTGVVGRGDEQDDKINDAQRAAQAAWDWADESHDAAVQAQRDADAAEAAAGAAQQSADSAAADAASASASASQAIADAASATQAATAAQGSADSAAQSARTAQQTADAAQRSANAAQGSADAAQASANAANAHATAALNSLSTVEDVVDTLTWITEHGTMARTADTAVDPSKVYFVRDNDGDYTVGGNRYSIVQEPAASGLSSYYELTIDKSVENYIATHLSVTNEGLWLTPTESNGYRVLVATGGSGKTYPTAGTYIIDGSGTTVAQFTGTGISFADDRTFYIGDSDAYIFFDGNGHINIGGSNVTIGGSTTLAELLAKYDATITSDDISVSKTGGTATITVGSDTVTISDGAAGAQGPKGDTGDQGPQGPQGPAGHSPAITTTKNSDGSVTIYVDGTATSTVDAGEDGQTPTVTTTKNSDGSVTIYVNGTASNTVEAGADGTSYYTYVRYSASSDGKNMVTTPTSATKYIGVYTGTSSSVPAYTSFKWSKYVGEDGSDADPLTVTSHAVDYQLSTSGTMAPTGNWSTTPLAPTTTQYLWTRTTLGFSDGTTSVSYSVGGKAGTNGQNGTNGTNGTDGGRWYAGTKITGTSTTATVFSGSGITAAVVGDMYLNTSTYNTYRCTVAGNASTAKWVYTANIKGATGEQGPQGETGAKGDTGAQGPQGETGSAGTNGVSITGVEHQYYLSTSSTSQTGGSWTVKPAAYVRGRYYWERWKVSFSSGDPTYTTATLAEEVTSAWTAIESNEDAIALKANSSDVYTKTAVDGKITQEVTDRNAAITAKANEITSTVSQTYTTKQEFADLQVGGRNLLGSTSNPSSKSVVQNDGSSRTFGDIGNYNDPVSAYSFEDYDGYSNSVKWTSTGTGNRGVGWYTKVGEIKAGTEYTFTCKVRSSVAVSVHTHTAWRNGSATATYTGWTSAGATTVPANTWTDYSCTFEPHSSAQLDWEYFVAICFTGSSSGVTFQVAHAKLEKGNKATDWTPAPEDMVGQTEFTEAKSEIKQTTDGITSTVSKISGVKYLEAASAGWSFANIKFLCAEGYIGSWAVKSAEDVRVGDAVLIKGYDLTRQCNVYIKGTVNSISGNSLNITSHGYEDVLPSDVVISSINQSAESVKIQASKVEIDGTAVFSAIKSSTDAAYDAKGAAATVQSNLDNIVIGGRNLLTGTDVWLTTFNSYSSCGKSSETIPAGSVVTVSVEVNADNLVWDTTSSTHRIGFETYLTKTGGGSQYFGVWAGNAISESSNVVEAFTGSIHKRISKTFTLLGDFELGRSGYIYTQGVAQGTVKVGRAKIEYGNRATDWSPSEADIVKRTQRIWYRWNSATAPAAPTSWVTKGDDGSALWTKMHVAITSTHKYIYTCEQFEMADGTLGHTDVLLDNTITVIDGGNIITGSVTANKLNASDINASKTLTVGAMTDAAAATILNSNVQVGGRNLLRNTGSLVSGSMVLTRATVDGDTIKLAPTTSSSYAKFRVDYLDYSDHADGEYTLSFEYRVSDDSTSYTQTQLVAYIGFNVASRVGNTFSSSYDRFCNETISTDYSTEWTRASVTVSVPSELTTGQASALVAGSNLTVQFGSLGSRKPTLIRGIKLEKGNKATDWSPAPEDVDTAVSDAAKTATNYITQVDQNGITIHPSGGTSNRVEIDADGMEVFKGNVSVASYGDTARIGKEAGPRVVVESYKLSMYAGSTGETKIAEMKEASIGDDVVGLISTDVIVADRIGNEGGPQMTPTALYVPDGSEAYISTMTLGASGYRHKISGFNFGYAASITNQNGIVTFNPGMGVKPTAVFVTHALASNETNDVAKLAVPFVWAIDSATQVQVRWKRTDTNDYLRNNAIGYYWLAIY